MSVVKASLLRRAALTLVAGAAIAAPMGARASMTDGLTFRLGAFIPSTNTVRNVTDFAAWGGGIDYKTKLIPTIFNGDNWSSSISVDLHYSERSAGVFRYIPVSFNQVYTFDENGGKAPYAGYCLTVATFGGTDNAHGHQPTITRFGGGLILGCHLSSRLSLEGRYEWIDAHHSAANPEGFRAYVGWHF